MNGLLQAWINTVEMPEDALEEDLHQDASMDRREEETTNNIAFEVLVLPDRCVDAPDTDQESMYPVAPELAVADVWTRVATDQDHHLATDYLEDHHPVAQDRDQDHHSPWTTSRPVTPTWTSPMLLFKSHNW